MTEDNIEGGICNEAGFRQRTPTEVKDYLANIHNNEVTEKSKFQIISILKHI